MKKILPKLLILPVSLACLELTSTALSMQADTPPREAQTLSEAPISDELIRVITDGILCPKVLTPEIQDQIMSNPNGEFTWRGVKFRVVGGRDVLQKAGTEWMQRKTETKVVKEANWDFWNDWNNFRLRPETETKAILDPAYFISGVQQNLGNSSVLRASFAFQSYQEEVVKGGGLWGTAATACKWWKGGTDGTNIITIEHIPEFGNPTPEISPEELSWAKELLGLNPNQVIDSQLLMKTTMNLIGQSTLAKCQDVTKLTSEVGNIKEVQDIRLAYEVITLDAVRKHNTQTLIDEQVKAELIANQKEEIIKEKREKDALIRELEKVQAGRAARGTPSVFSPPEKAPEKATGQYTRPAPKPVPKPTDTAQTTPGFGPASGEVGAARLRPTPPKSAQSKSTEVPELSEKERVALLERMKRLKEAAEQNSGEQ